MVLFFFFEIEMTAITYNKGFMLAISGEECLQTSIGSQNVLTSLYHGRQNKSSAAYQ
jgi:hypothetical protein